MRWLVMMLALAPWLARPAQAQQGFQSPTGNIHCARWGDELRCDIRQYHYRPPQPRAGCPESFGGAVQMTGRGAPVLLCHGDTIMDQRHPILPYGTAWQGGGFACTSSQTGIRCVNAAGRGWEMARARLSLF